MALFKEEIVLQRLKIKTHLIEPPKRKVDGSVSLNLTHVNHGVFDRTGIKD